MEKLFSDILIELHVPDFQATKKFYKSLGFNIVWERKPNERKGYLVMKRGNSIINFYCGNGHVYEQSYFKTFPKNTKRGYAVEIIIPIDNIEPFYKKIYKRYKKNIVGQLKVRFLKPDFRMIDPFGFYLRFVERYDWVNNNKKL
jgi:catechol 2,3-dioxygenase-like lactoylglutathione lyase family enzyme